LGHPVSQSLWPEPITWQDAFNHFPTTELYQKMQWHFEYTHCSNDRGET
jgi:hypothetical protein